MATRVRSLVAIIVSQELLETLFHA